MLGWISGRLAGVIGFLACFGLVGVALAIQVHYKLEPCPLCISQRMVFMGLGLLFLLMAILPQVRIYRGWAAVLQVLTALGGAGVAIRHWYIQAHKESMVVDCGVGFDYMFENFPFKKAVQLVFRGTGDCATIDWTFLGLTIPQLSLIAFVVLAGYAVVCFRSVNAQKPLA